MSKFRNICKQSNGLTTGRRALPLGLLSVLLTLTGCKSETPDEPLSFSDAVVEFSTGMSDGDELWSELPETARSTRAIGPINSLADLKALTDGFGVFAYFTDATIWTDAISGKAVAKVVMTCDSYNGTAYTGNSTLYASASGTTFVICNEHSEAKGGDQLRVQAIEITYAQ